MFFEMAMGRGGKKVEDPFPLPPQEKNQLMKKSLFTTRYIEMTSSKDHNGCWIWPYFSKITGYYQTYLDGKRILVHRASYEAHFGPIPEGMLVCHSCDVRRCVNPHHLFLGTQKNNMQDALSKGRHICQTDPSFTKLKRVRKLTDDSVLAIKSSEESLKYLSEKYGVSKANVSMIRRNKRKQLVTA